MSLSPKFRKHTLKSDILTFHKSKVNAIRSLQSKLCIAKQMLESSELGGEQMGKKRILPHLTSQSLELPSSLQNFNRAGFECTWEILADREEVVSGLIEDITKKTIELIKEIPEESFSFKDMRRALFFASVGTPCIYIALSTEQLTPFWARTIAISGGVLSGLLTAFSKRRVSEQSKDKVLSKLVNLNSQLDAILPKYWQGVEELSERLCILLPEPEAKRISRIQKFSDALLVLDEN